MTILDICHFDAEGKCLWEDHNIKNTFHYNGEQFLLNLAFNTSSGITIPSSYYLGLDNRTTINTNDTLASLSQEPTQNGYARQPVSSLNGFSVVASLTNDFQATSVVVSFQAVGGSWGPVSNLFLSNVSGSTGYLLASSALSTSRTLTDGQFITVRIAVGLRNC
jgi:hypothetical protein